MRKANRAKVPEQRSTVTGSRSIFSGALIITTVIVSLAVLAFVDLGLGWSLDAAEKSLVVFLVFLVSLAVSRWRRHARQG